MHKHKHIYTFMHIYICMYIYICSHAYGLVSCIAGGKQERDRWSDEANSRSENDSHCARGKSDRYTSAKFSSLPNALYKLTLTLTLSFG